MYGIHLIMYVSLNTVCGEEALVNRIAQELKRRGWSQTMLAQRAGLDRMYVNRLIHQIKAPTVPTAVKVARALGVKVEELWHF